jgi:chaperonin GroES
MNIRPLHDRVVVRIVPPKEKTASGALIIPDAAKRLSEGVVVAVGEGRAYDGPGEVQTFHVAGGEQTVARYSRQKPLVKADDIVVFGLYAGTEIQGMDGHWLLREDEIAGVVVEPEAELLERAFPKAVKKGA